MSENIKGIIESLLFVAEEPISMDTFRNIIAFARTEDLNGALQELAQEYNQRRGGILLQEVAGGFQIRTKPELAPWIKLYLKPNPARLSKAALETLAIVAYHQPIIRSDIERIRGVDSGGVLRLLLERKLIRVLGRKEIPGRPMIYATTKRFLEVFDLKDLKDLPSLKEIEELGRQASEEPLTGPLPESAPAGTDEGKNS